MFYLQLVLHTLPKLTSSAQIRLGKLFFSFFKSETNTEYAGMKKKSSLGETFILFLLNLISIFIHCYECHTVFLTDTVIFFLNIIPPHGRR